MCFKASSPTDTFVACVVYSRLHTLIIFHGYDVIFGHTKDLFSPSFFCFFYFHGHVCVGVTNLHYCNYLDGETSRYYVYQGRWSVIVLNSIHHQQHFPRWCSLILLLHEALRVLRGNTPDQSRAVGEYTRRGSIFKMLLPVPAACTF